MLRFLKIDFEKDIEKCVEFRRDSYVASFPDSDEWQNYWNEDSYRLSIVSHADKFPDGLWHIWLKDQLIGQLEFTYSENHGHVNLFYLRPENRGTGVSSLVHSFVLEALRSKACKTATLRVTPMNIRARRYYEKLGWIDKGIDSNYNYVHLYSINL